MATELKLNYLDINIYSAINQIRGQKNRPDIISILKEIVKVIDFEFLSKVFLNDRIEMLLQNNKMINRLNRNKISNDVRFFHDRFTSTQKSPSKSDTSHFTRTPKQTSMTDISHNLEVNIENIFGELTPAKFRNLILKLH